MRARSLLVLVLLAACDRTRAPESPDSAGPGDASAPASESARPQPRVIDLGDGAAVEILVPGEGPAPQAGGRVLFHYKAFVQGQSEPFDTTRKVGIPLEVELDGSSSRRPIEGLARALPRLRQGTRARVTIPALLGWGAAGNPGAGVPPDSDLMFEVEVVDVRAP